MNASDRHTKDRKAPRPLQFRLATALVIMAAWSLLFGTLRWLGVSPQGSLIILVILAVSVGAALVLVVLIARSTSEDDR